MPKVSELVCTVNGCVKMRWSGDYCSKHLTQMNRHGKILERTQYDPNTTRVVGNTIEIDLRDKQCGVVAVALVDLDDSEKVLNYTWSLLKSGYASSHIKGVSVCMHKIILPSAKIADHINGNKLDNRKTNLREVTASQSSSNTAPRQTRHAKGVIFHTASGLWYAYAAKNGRRHSGGYHKKYEDAVEARRVLAIEVQGDYAYESRNQAQAKAEELSP